MEGSGHRVDLWGLVSWHEGSGHRVDLRGLVNWHGRVRAQGGSPGAGELAWKGQGSAAVNSSQRTNSNQIFHLSARMRNERNTCLPKRSGK